MVKEENRRLGPVLFIIIVLIYQPGIFAQFSGSFSYSAFSDDNPERTSSGESEFVNSFLADLSLQPFESEFYALYSGSYSDYRSNSFMSFQTHSLGFSYAFNSDRSSIDGDKNVFTSFSYSLKKGQRDYAVYDYSRFSGYINGRFPLAESFFIRGGCYFSYKYYDDLNELTHFESVFSLQLSHFFSSGTGIFLDNNIGLMNYSFLSETVNSSKGKGRWQSSSVNKVNFNVVQLRSGIRISQSLADNTGISLRYLHRENLKDSKGMYLSSSYVYSGDDELWDDPYAFSGNEVSAEFTQNFPEDINIKLSAEYNNRLYTNNPADSLNSVQRRDQKTSFWGGVSKTFFDVFFLDFIELTLEYMYVKNLSGEEIFSYKNNLYMIGIQFGF